MSNAPAGPPDVHQPPLSPDCNLLFGVHALQLELIDDRRFAQACPAWAARKDALLADAPLELG
jgi:hypothetical protein